MPACHGGQKKRQPVNAHGDIGSKITGVIRACKCHFMEKLLLPLDESQVFQKIQLENPSPVTNLSQANSTICSNTFYLIFLGETIKLLPNRGGSPLQETGALEVINHRQLVF